MKISISIIIWEKLISRQNKMHDDPCCSFQTLCIFTWKWALCIDEFEFGAFSSSCLFPVPHAPSCPAIYVNAQPWNQEVTSQAADNWAPELLGTIPSPHLPLLPSPSLSFFSPPPPPPPRASCFPPSVARRLHGSCLPRKTTDYIYAFVAGFELDWVSVAEGSTFSEYFPSKPPPSLAAKELRDE